MSARREAGSRRGAGRRRGVERGDRGSSVGAASWVVLTRGGGGSVAAGGEGEGEREGEGQGPVGRLPSWAGPPAASLGFFYFLFFSYDV